MVQVCFPVHVELRFTIVAVAPWSIAGRRSLILPWNVCAWMMSEAWFLFGFFCRFLSANNEIRLIEPSVRVKVCIIPCGGYSWDLLTLCDKWFDHSKRLESKNWRSCLRKINASTAVQRQNFYNMFSINNANNIPKFGFTLESKHIL